MSVDLTVSIINTNNRELLRNCLRSIFEGTQRITLEVYVVDNACTDGSAEMVRAEFPQVKLIFNDRRLRFCANHNQVLRAGRGRYLLILNEDTVIPPGTFEAMVEFMDRTPQAGALGITIRNPDGSVQATYADFPTLWSEFLTSTGLSRLLNKGLYPSHPLQPELGPIPVDWVCGACLLVRRGAMQQAGMLDEAFLIYAEETDWCYRIRQAGWQVYFLPDQHIYHLQGQGTSQDRPRRRFRLHRSALLFFRKHYGWRRTTALRTLLACVSLAHLIWLPVSFLALLNSRPALELRYNWRTLYISLFDDARYDCELFEMG